MRMTQAALGALAKGDVENFAAAATPGGIEAQEKAGQKALVASADMPKIMRPSREAFEKSGFTFGEDVDELFVDATLPAGWKREASDHAMHSYILDEQGRKRVGVFYKAAFYDRRADARLMCRFTVQKDYDLPADKVAYIVKDADKEIYRTIETPRTGYESDDQHEAVATKWLTEAFPNYADPTAW